MPVKIPDTLPAMGILESENIFVMAREPRPHQDIRPLRIAVLNLMPTKIVTETQILRLLGNTPAAGRHHLHPHGHARVAEHARRAPATRSTSPSTTSGSERFDGLIITGAPVETLPFEEVDYWPELVRADGLGQDQRLVHAAHLLGRAGRALPPLRRAEVPAAREDVRPLPAPAEHPHEPLLRGFDEVFFAPHSRHTEVARGHRGGEGPEAARRSRRRRASTWLLRRTAAWCS